MNFIESVQKKYLPTFYESRYTSRKNLALSSKQKCQQHPEELTLYELKIILKVLQQFGLFENQPLLEEKEKILRTEIQKNSIYSGIASMLPFAVREFHRLKLLRRLLIAGIVFCGVDYLLMHNHFKDYIAECRKTAQRQIGKLMQHTQIPI